jgi:hypothetical protein
MYKRKRTKGQTMIYKTQHKKLKTLMVTYSSNINQNEQSQLICNHLTKATTLIDENQVTGFTTGDRNTIYNIK